VKRLIQSGTKLVADLAVLSLAYWLAFLLRFEMDLGLRMVKLLFFTWPYVVVLQYVVLVFFHVHRFAWSYVGLREAYRILAATAVSVGALGAVRLGLEGLGGYAWLVRIPLGVLAMDFVLAFVGVAGIRVVVRALREYRGQRKLAPPATPAMSTLIVGAGQAGLLVAKELEGHPELGVRAVGFVDDDPLMVGSVMHGLRVLGTTADLAAVRGLSAAEEAIIAIPSAVGRDIRRISKRCKEAGLRAKVLPSLTEFVGGRVSLTAIRDVAIEDLLRRPPVELDEEGISGVVRGRVVLVTGAGGSIGSELCRQACRWEPKALVLVEQAENALFHIHRELRTGWPDLEIVPQIGDVTDAVRMAAVFDCYKPNAVFHAAAHKHVPMMEWNSGEAVKNNIVGTRTLAAQADRSGVSEFVMISTDKAVRPTSVMGASKRVAELCVQAMSQRSQTRFVAVRFGNVLGSQGSVVPIFEEQIARGGPVTVTHPDMKRYFMTIPEACQLVLQAGSMGSGGEVFILDMGEPVRIVDLAKDLIRLSGLKPDEDIDVVFSGVRPGEKLFEELSVGDEHAEKTQHPKIFVGRIQVQDHDAVMARVDELAGLADSGDAEAIRRELVAIIPEYTPDEGLAGASQAEGDKEG